MKKSKIRCAVLSGGEGDLYVFGELHKRRDVEIAFVYDRNPAAVALEIAEILHVPRVNRPEDIASFLPLDCVVVGEPRDRFVEELALVGDAEVLDHTQALARFGRPAPSVETSATTAGPADVPYTMEDALAGFERLFDRKRLLKFLLDVAVETTGAANGSIMLYSPEARELYIAYATGLSERVVRNTRQKIGEGIAGNVAQERKGKLIRQAAVGTLYRSDRDRVNISSACSVPLVEDDRLLGVLNVSATGAGRELSVGDLETLERLSRRMARVLSESLKLQEIQLRSGEMNLRQSVGELVEKPGSTPDKFALLSALVAELTGAESVEVFISTHSGDWLVLGGSNRRLSTTPDFVRVGKGAMARAYLERRTIILTEPVDPQSAALASSFVFVPLTLGESLGVATIEFAERHRLDDFLAVKNSIALELSRFIASERRERRLRSELTALARISESAAAILSCRALQDLADVVARTIVDALECERASVRLRSGGAGEWTAAYYDAAGRPEATWSDEDAERFAKLDKKRAPYHLAFLDVASGRGEQPHGHHSVLAVPIRSGDELLGGIITYDKRASTAVEDAVFSSHDESIIDQVIAMVLPTARSLSSGDASARPSYEDILAGNGHRLSRVTDAEMSRADRYHQPFALLVLRVPMLSALFAADEARALSAVDEIRQGIQTRTRKSDYGAWIRRDTYALVSLEGTRRIKFLVSRLVAYLKKDLGKFGTAIGPADVEIGIAVYPGASRSAETLFDEAIAALKPHAAD
jgi:GAF domain-containing protein